MNKFSNKSKRLLKTCHQDLQDLFNEVIKYCDCKIIEGFRSPERQDELFDQERTKLKGGESKHNVKPSLAVDVVPYPVDWNNKDRFYYFGGLVKGIASQMNLNIRWGGDWDGDNNFKDQTFHDLPHFELKK